MTAQSQLSRRIKIFILLQGCRLPGVTEVKVRLPDYSNETGDLQTYLENRILKKARIPTYFRLDNT